MLYHCCTHIHDLRHKWGNRRSLDCIHRGVQPHTPDKYTHSDYIRMNLFHYIDTGYLSDIGDHIHRDSHLPNRGNPHRSDYIHKHVLQHMPHIYIDQDYIHMNLDRTHTGDPRHTLSNYNPRRDYCWTINYLNCWIMTN